jgi:hypothetical protein
LTEGINYPSITGDIETLTSGHKVGYTNKGQVYFELSIELPIEKDVEPED